MNLSVTHEVIMVWIAAGLTMVVLVAGARLIAASQVVTGRFANLVESMVEFVREYIAKEFLGEHWKTWFAFFAACQHKFSISSHAVHAAYFIFANFSSHGANSGY